MNTDRCVHARTHDGVEVVRYDRGGKWYAEPTDGTPRRALTLARAVELATQPGSTAVLRLPGGGAFDSAVRRHRSERSVSEG